MKKFFLHVSQIYFIAFIFLAIFCNAGAASKQPKRLSNHQGLIPFPRIGRSGENTWEYNPGNPRSMAERLSALYAFPRIIRSQAINNLPKRTAGQKNMNTGLWFGPRLGRVHKREVYLYDLPHDYTREIYPGDVSSQYSPRRESDELGSDDADFNIENL